MTLVAVVGISGLPGAALSAANSLLSSGNGGVSLVTEMCAQNHRHWSFAIANLRLPLRVS